MPASDYKSYVGLPRSRSRSARRLSSAVAAVVERLEDRRLLAADTAGDTYLLAKATGVEFREGDPPQTVVLNGAIDTAMDVDFYRIVVEPGQTVEIHVDPVGTNFDTYLRIWNSSIDQPDSPAYEKYEDDNGGGGMGSSITFTPRNGDIDYFIAVTSKAHSDSSEFTANTGTPGPTGKYQLRVSTAEMPTISGKVYTDRDSFGDRDPSDIGRANAQVYIDRNQNGLFDGTDISATTEADGSYVLGGILEDSNKVAVTLPTGPGIYAAVIRPFGGIYTEVASGTGYDFGTSIRSWVVTTLTDENDGLSDPAFGTGTSLREALDYANYLGGDATITFSPDLTASGPKTLNLTLGELVLGDYEGTTTIIGPGASKLTLSGSGQTGKQVFKVNTGVISTISGLTIRDAEASEGGAIANRGTLTLNDMVLSNNRAGYGGGAIRNFAGSLTLNRTTFSGNIADTGGGAIQNSATLTVNSSTFSSNSARREGGSIQNTGTLNVNSSKFSSNSTPYRGGAIWSGGTLTVTGSTLSTNSAGDGGAAYVSTGTAKFASSTLSGNQAKVIGSGTLASYSGAGIFNGGSSVLTVDRSTLDSNIATGPGGGIFNSTATAKVTVQNSTIALNKASQGGGIASAGPLTVTNATVVSNTATTTGGIRFTGTGSAAVNNTIVAKNIGGDAARLLGQGNFIGNGTSSGLTNGVDGNIVGSAASPLDPKLNALAADGGPTRIMLPQTGSPVIDKGYSLVRPPGLPDTDQRGTGFGRVYNGRVDIGAIEFEGDTDDTISEVALLAANTKVVGQFADARLTLADDVDLIKFNAFKGQKVGFDVDSRNGSALDTHVRVFNSSGTGLASNDDGLAPGETATKFSYLEYTFPATGTYYVAVSNKGNTAYNATTGAGDKLGSGPNGDYRLTLTDRTKPDTYQAEWATLAGGTLASATHAGFSGTGYADVGSLNSSVQFGYVSATAAGVKKLSFRFANGSTVSRPMDVYVNGVKSGSLSFLKTGSWTTWATTSINVSLRAGNNVIKLVSPNSTGGPNIDQLLVTAV